MTRQCKKHGSSGFYVYALFLRDEPEKVKYIGQTWCPPCRFKAHLDNADRDIWYPVYHWIRKNGTDSIGIRIMCCAETVELVNEAESFWIAEAREHGCHIFNVRDGKMNDRRGARQPEEAVASMRAKLTGRKRSPEHQAKITAAVREGLADPEVRARMSERARNRSPEHSAALSEANRRRFAAPEARQVLADRASATHKGRKRSEKTRQRLSDAHKGKTPSEETRRKIAEANRQRAAAAREAGTPYRHTRISQ